MARLIAVVLTVGVLEVAWALFCSVKDVNIFVFYAVLIVASLVFWVPGVATKRAGPA